ncbi:MAG: relaxase/mobilization nuclease domain-containing protein, partial [Acetobacteraceae bacterium]|nr:relaxase/mobilization nuclease domain-containing protein [Acetobacteraceae bacterium]
MNAKGKIRSSGAQLARYVMTGKDGELVQVIDARGWQDFGKDPVAAFDRMEQWAAEHTESRKPFFHGHIRLAPGERLTDPQWMDSLDRMEKRLGFEGQPRIVSFHIEPETGEKHLHAAWFRGDLENECAIDPGLYKNKLVQLSRTLELEFGLRELTGERQPDDRAREADRNEYEESKRLGTDVRAIRNGILDCLEHADSGKAFKAALEERSLMLANGDRRDCFVVIDEAGGHHALNKKLTGMTLAETRDRLADLDRT